MNRLNVILVVVFVAFGLFTAAAAWAVYTAVVKPGVVAIRVAEKFDGERVSMNVPAVFVDAAIRVAARANGCEFAEVHGEWGPAIAAAWRELEAYPDFVLVEVESDDEHVIIRKAEGDLVIEVDGRDAEVSVRLPQRTARLAVQAIE